MSRRPTSYAAIAKHSLVNLPATAHKRRLREGLTLRAAASQIGISKDTLRRIEIGQDASTQVLVRVFAWLDGDR
jgi:transcriptional regulator with XRE-family HTH domain